MSSVVRFIRTHWTRIAVGVCVLLIFSGRARGFVFDAASDVWWAFVWPAIAPIVKVAAAGAVIAFAAVTMWRSSRSGSGSKSKPSKPAARSEDRAKRRAEERSRDEAFDKLSDKIHHLNRKADEHWRSYRDAESDWARHGSPHLSRDSLNHDQRKILERSDREKEAYDRLQGQIRDLERQRDRLR